MHRAPKPLLLLPAVCADAVFCHQQGPFETEIIDHVCVHLARRHQRLYQYSYHIRDEATASTTMEIAPTQPPNNSCHCHCYVRM